MAQRSTLTRLVHLRINTWCVSHCLYSPLPLDFQTVENFPLIFVAFRHQIGPVLILGKLCAAFFTIKPNYYVDIGESFHICLEILISEFAISYKLNIIQLLPPKMRSNHQDVDDIVLQFWRRNTVKPSIYIVFVLFASRRHNSKQYLWSPDRYR